ncbi:MAG: kdpE [Deltaproteobacteria bacterium]|nr:kdpE [Deltaproteobacteria bacterium]
METVLVIEDDREVRQFLSDVLLEHGFRVAEAASAAQADELIESSNPVAILLDLGLPDRDGFHLLEKMRQRGPTPIIVLSARDGDNDKVRALDSGADDYLTKPFSPSELLARIRVALRHARGHVIVDEPMLSVGPIQIDHARHEVMVDGSQVRLTPIEFRLLVQLARRAGKVMTHRQLLESVWGASKGNQTHYLRVHMQALRRKIERDPARPRWLATEPGIGYRLRDE